MVDLTRLREEMSDIQPLFMTPKLDVVGRPWKPKRRRRMTVVDEKAIERQNHSGTPHVHRGDDGIMIYVDRVPHLVGEQVSREDILALSDLAQILPRTRVWVEGTHEDREIQHDRQVIVVLGMRFRTGRERR